MGISIIWEADIYRSGKSSYIFVHNSLHFGTFNRKIKSNKRETLKQNVYNKRIYDHWTPIFLKQRVQVMYDSITWWHRQRFKSMTRPHWPCFIDGSVVGVWGVRGEPGQPGHV